MTHDQKQLKFSLSDVKALKRLFLSSRPLELCGPFQNLIKSSSLRKKKEFFL